MNCFWCDIGHLELCAKLKGYDVGFAFFLLRTNNLGIDQSLNLVLKDKAIHGRMVDSLVVETVVQIIDSIHLFGSSLLGQLDLPLSD